MKIILTPWITKGMDYVYTAPSGAVLRLCQGELERAFNFPEHLDDVKLQMTLSDKYMPDSLKFRWDTFYEITYYDDHIHTRYILRNLREYLNLFGMKKASKLYWLNIEYL
jgi:hypothetical protein